MREAPGPWTETTYDHNEHCLLLTTKLPGPDFDCGCPRTIRDMTPEEIAWFEANITPAMEEGRRQHERIGAHRRDAARKAGIPVPGDDEP